MTNGDYIRKTMTDEELVKNQRLLCNLTYSFSLTCPSYARCPFGRDCLWVNINENALLEWLKVEREEESPVEDV